MIRTNELDDDFHRDSGQSPENKIAAVGGVREHQVDSPVLDGVSMNSAEGVLLPEECGTRETAPVQSTDLSGTNVQERHTYSSLQAPQQAEGPDLKRDPARRAQVATVHDREKLERA